MTAVYERLQNCYKSIQDQICVRPKVALVLGSGLGDYADGIRIESTLDYHEISGAADPADEDDGSRDPFSDECGRGCEL